MSRFQSDHALVLGGPQCRRGNMPIRGAFKAGPFQFDELQGREGEGEGGIALRCGLLKMKMLEYNFQPENSPRSTH